MAKSAVFTERYMFGLALGSLLMALMFAAFILLGNEYMIVPALLGAAASGLSIGRVVEHRQAKRGRGIQELRARG